MEEKNLQEKLKFLKKRLKSKFVKMAEFMIINKIKKIADLLYEKQISGVMGTAGHDPYSLNLANNGDTQSEDNQNVIPVDSNIPHTSTKVNEDFIKLLKNRDEKERRKL